MIKDTKISFICKKILKLQFKCCIKTYEKKFKFLFIFSKGIELWGIRKKNILKFLNFAFNDSNL